MDDLHDYRERPYTVMIRQDADGDYVAHIDELPGCMAHGATQAEALEALDQAMELWITDCLESGDPIPEPALTESLPSGKWVQRVPKTLHKKLVSLAKDEHVSLNQFVVSILAEAVGVRQRIDTLHEMMSVLEALEDRIEDLELATNPEVHTAIERLIDDAKGGSHG